MSFGRAKDEGNSKERESAEFTPHSLMKDGAKPEAYIGKGSKITGTLSFSGPVEIEGEVEGEITCQDRLTIGEAAIVKAKIHGPEITVKGTLIGDVVATKKLILRRPAKVSGNISSAVLSVEEGVVFEGQCAMKAVSDGGVTQSPKSESGALMTSNADRVVR